LSARENKDAVMTPEQIVATAKQILDTQPLGNPEPSMEATGKLTRVVVLFLGMEDTKLRNAILAEAQLRVGIAAARGKKPWEV